ncbi:MAG: MATE family efflux transporter [Gammaproteobacteria bacterium]|nr:MAG: MATE family efflux transporter [Gammaproteobacteria bacterium]
MRKFFPNKQRARQIMAISVPIIGAMISQNILNLVDSAMVGHLGSAALAAVGVSNFLNFMAVAIFMGLATGVQVIVARRIGENRPHEAAVPLNGSLLLNLLFALPVSVLLYHLAPWLITFVIEDPEVVAQAQPYIQMRLAGIAAIACNFCFRGFWSGIKKTHYYMWVLFAMHALNILLNYVLIFGNFGFPELGILGAGLGTTISMVLGFFCHFILCMKKGRIYGFMTGLPSLSSIKNMLSLSVPASLQQFFFSAGFSMLFWIIGQVGTDSLAAASVLTNLALVSILPCIAFGMSSSTLVSESLGRNEPDEAYRWAWEVSSIAILFISSISIIILLFSEPILSIFLHEQAALEVAKLPLLITAFGLPLEALGMVMMSSLMGAGATKTTLQISLGMQWLIFLPLAWFVGPVSGLGITAIWIVQALYRSTQTMIYAFFWKRKTWVGISV